MIMVLIPNQDEPWQKAAIELWLKIFWKIIRYDRNFFLKDFQILLKFYLHF